MMIATITPPAETFARGEQARRLRALAADRNARLDVSTAPSRTCHTIVIWGGKGGTGRSMIALNLALLFANRGQSVGLLDAASGLGNIELLCGLNGYWNLTHVAQGCRELRDVLSMGSSGIKVLSGAHCLLDRTENRDFHFRRMVQQLQAFEQSLDWLIVDASGGSLVANRDLIAASDDLLIVTTPESTAIAEAYASVKSISSTRRPRVGILLNQVETTTQAYQIFDRLEQATQSFLQIDLHRRGLIPRDPAVPQSVNARVPLVIQSPDSPASIELGKVAARWTRPNRTSSSTGFFSRLFESEE